MYWTEGGPDYKDPGYLTDWCNWGVSFSAILRNGCRSITAWNLALDERGRPNIGPFSCGGVVTINSQTKEITRSGIVLGLCSLLPSLSVAVLTALTRKARPLIYSTSALKIQTANRVLVLTNAGPAREIEMRLENRAARVSLKENSVTTLAWR